MIRLVGLSLVAALFMGCAGPPSDPNNICRVLVEENDGQRMLKSAKAMGASSPCRVCLCASRVNFPSQGQTRAEETAGCGPHGPDRPRLLAMRKRPMRLWSDYKKHRKAFCTAR